MTKGTPYRPQVTFNNINGTATRPAARGTPAVAATAPPVMTPGVQAAANALRAGQFEVAETRLRQRLHDEPNDAFALHLLGELAGQVGQPSVAEDLFIQALEVAPDLHAARYALAVVLHRQSRAAEALVQTALLRKARPNEPLYRAMEAAVRAALGDHAESLALYEALFAEGMAGPRLLLSYGHGLKTVGRSDESAAVYRGLATSRHPENKPLCGEAWWSLANLKTQRLDAADRAAMQAALDERTTSQDSSAHLHYALGKSLEDMGDPDAAFHHYAHGAAIRRRTTRYDATAMSARVREITEALTPALLDAHADEGASAPDPIFVVGLPRSGTTLVEQILASHPEVEGTMELTALPAIARKAGLEGRNANPRALGRLRPADLLGLGEEYLAATRVYRKTARPRFVDKLPDNWLHAGLIRLILPRATIIDVRRSPLASGFSAFKQLFARGQTFSYDLDDIGRYYRDYVAFMNHVDRVAPGAVHHIVYEDLIEDAETQVRALLAHGGLPFDPACLAFHETQRAIWTPSAQQVRQPLYREGLDQWRVFEHHLEPLRNALGPALSDWRPVQ